MSEQITWTGLSPAELADKIKAQPFAAKAEQLMTKITLTALGHAQQRTPVRTGTLRRSETTRVEPGGERGWIGTNVKYAPFAHDRVPFFELAIEDSRSEVQKLLQDAGDDYTKGLT